MFLVSVRQTTLLDFIDAANLRATCYCKVFTMTSIQLNRRKVVNRYQIPHRLMLFDLSIYGHHPSYIKYLTQYWYQYNCPGQLLVLVSPRFFEVHSDVVELAQQLDSESI